MAALYMRSPLPDRHMRNEETKLPAGRCNFTNLDSGVNAPRCGCRRFWDKATVTPQPGTTTGTGFCMCEHHACFHDDGPGGEAVPTSVLLAGAVPLQSRVSSQYEPNMAIPQDSLPNTFRWNQTESLFPGVGIPPIPSQCLLPSETPSSTSGSQSRYSRPFGGRGLDTLSHIPIPGTVVTRKMDLSRQQVIEDARGNKYVQSLTEAATPSVRASQDHNPEVDYQKTIASAQKVLEMVVEAQAQKAIALRTGYDDAAPTVVKESESVPEALHQSTGLHAEINELNQGFLIPRLRNIVNNLAEYPTKIQNHEQRLSRLENGSFVHGATEDLQDADDKLDTRCCDLEERMRDVEKAQATLNDLSSFSGINNVSSFSSRASENSSAIIASTIDSARIEALEAQVAELQASSLPSHARPWEWEVVFLPYGPRLLGIWSSQRGVSQWSRINSTAPDDWTQTPCHNDSIAVAAQAQFANDTGAWEQSMNNLGEYDEPEWHFARACRHRNRIDERLRSRGLVKKIQICGPDARDVQAAVMTAFKELPDLLAQDCYSQRDENAGNVPKSQRQYLGLEAQWIPLRKIHKDSSLHFLTPAEMITQALWTAPFLSSSVAMRHSNLRRLYVTHRDSYIQHLGHQSSDWTWAKLRLLPRYYSDATKAHTPEADAHEPCWEFDDRLDPPSESIHSSFASQISELSVESLGPALEDMEPEELMSRSDHFSSPALSRKASTTPTSVAPLVVPLTPFKERNPFRPIHTRTVSMSALVPIASPGGKRRIKSFDHEGDVLIQSAPTPTPAPLDLSAAISMTKRRRISRSPSRLRDTPRYSNGPPSPYTVFERERGLTPFAYATPHSTAPYFGPRSNVDVYEDEDDQEHLHGQEQDPGPRYGSTTDQDDDLDGAEGNALSDFDSEEQDHNRQVEDEWEGVDDRDVYTGQDDGTDAASDVPSEYPSTQQHLEMSRGAKTEKGFRIHVDDEMS